MTLPLRKKIFYGVVMVALTMTVGIFLCEGIIRIYNLYKGYQRAIWIPDRWLGYRHTAHNRFTYSIDEPQGKIFASHVTNSLGIVGRELSIPKPQGVIRVVILGDSFTEAFQMRDEKTFCAFLENFLNQSGKEKEKTYEVINAGVSGFSPISEYYYFKRELKKLDPDYVILQLYANDVHNDNEATAMSVLDRQGLPYRINRYFYENLYQTPDIQVQ